MKKLSTLVALLILCAFAASAFAQAPPARKAPPVTATTPAAPAAAAPAPSTTPAPGTAPGAGAPAAAPDCKVTGISPRNFVSRDDKPITAELVITGKCLDMVGNFTLAGDDPQSGGEITVTNPDNTSRFKATYKIGKDESGTLKLMINDPTAGATDTGFKIVIKDKKTIDEERAKAAQAKFAQETKEAVSKVNNLVEENRILANRLNDLEGKVKPGVAVDQINALIDSKLNPVNAKLGATFDGLAKVMARQANDEAAIGQLENNVNRIAEVAQPKKEKGKDNKKTMAQIYEDTKKALADWQNRPQ